MEPSDFMSTNSSGDFLVPQEEKESIEQKGSINQKDGIDNDGRDARLSNLFFSNVLHRIQLKSESIFEIKLEKAEGLYEAIHSLHINHQAATLNLYHKFYEQLESLAPDKMSEAYQKLYENLNNLRGRYNKNLEMMVDQLELDLYEISEYFNQLQQDELFLKNKLIDLEKKIHVLNTKKLQPHLATSSQHAFEYQIYQFQGIVERKYRILLKINELSALPETKASQKKIKHLKQLLQPRKPSFLTERLKMQKEILLKKLRKSSSFREVKKFSLPNLKVFWLYHPVSFLSHLLTRILGVPKDLKSVMQKLASCPSVSEMQILKRNLEIAIFSPRKVLSRVDSLKSFRYENEFLAWGDSYVKHVLNHPANWVNKYEVSLAIDRYSRAHVYETKVEPLNIERTDTLPSGYGSMMRKEGFRAANAQKTTLSLPKFVKGKKELLAAPIERFRIAQVPTKEAAIDALGIILKNSTRKVSLLHDNMLLTMAQFLDKKLALVHNKNLISAFKHFESQENLDQLNIGLKDPYTIADIQNLRKKYIQTNFGVNAGAVGTFKLGIQLTHVKLGWRKAFSAFNQHSVKRYHAVLREKLNQLLDINTNHLDRFNTDEHFRLFQRLGALVQVGQELEAIWFNEDYKKPEIGANQFKAPALLSVLDSLLGITVNTHCKSAKDRASLVESHALEILQSIEGNIYDKQVKLPQKIKHYLKRLTIPYGPEKNRIKLTDKQMKILCSSVFEWNEIEEILAKADFDAENWQDLFDIHLRHHMDQKVINAKLSLGVFQPDSVFLQHGRKKTRTVPLLDDPISKKAAKTFPKVTPESIYKKKHWNFNENNISDKIDKKEIAKLTELQRQKRLRRTVCQLAMDITKENTGVPGNKLNQGEPLRIFYSGFYRDYVRYQFFTEQNIEALKIEMEDALGLQELSGRTKLKILDEIQRIKKSRSSMTKQFAELNRLIKNIEYLKFQQFCPTIHVSS